MRHEPPANKLVLEYAWGKEHVKIMAPAELRAPLEVAATAQASVGDASWDEALLRLQDTKIFQIVVRKFAESWLAG